MRPISIAFSSLVAIAATSSASATDSWVVAREGAKPDRVVAVIDVATIRNKTDVEGWVARASPAQIEAAKATAKQAGKKRKAGEAAPAYIGPDIVFEGEAELVYEQRLKPDVAGTWFLVNCTQQTIAITSARILWRHKAMELQAGSPPHPLLSAMDRQIAAFICGMGSGAWPNGPPVAFGFSHVGDIGIQASNYVWPTLWGDANRPAFTYTPSQRDLDAAKARLADNIAKSDAAVTRAKAQNADMAHLADRAGRAGRRRGTIPVMEGWIEHTEEEFIAHWGPPIKLVPRADGVRVLTYRWGYVSELTHPSGAVLSSEDHTCVMDVFVKDRIFDYASQGAGCRE